ncbi:hypothetical protein FACS1894162_6600 [Bacteroidia bacterium]|nr:hypothetical protein FACS1894162_6600 [Bacteroidia bacterium]
MKMKKVILMMLLLTGAVSMNAQVRIGGTAAADKAILDLNASNTATNATQGLALPRATSKPAAPSIDGVLIYSGGSVWVSKSNAWEELGSGTGGGDDWDCGDALEVGSNSYATAPSAKDGSCWIAENLRETPAGFSYGASGYVYPNGDVANLATDGYLYKREAALVACPTGWHMPNDAEWASAYDTNPTDIPNIIFAGRVNVTLPVDGYGTFAWWWSASSQESRHWVSSATPTIMTVGNGGAATNMWSLRCMQD